MRKIKKIFSTIIVYVLVFGIVFSNLNLSVIATETPRFSIEDYTVNAGEEFTVEITLDNARNVFGGNFTLQYDSDLLEVSEYSFGEILSNHTKNCNLDYQSAGNLIRFTFSGSIAVGTDGVVLSLTFTAKEDAEDVTELTFDSYKFYGTMGTALSGAAVSGEITITVPPTETVLELGVTQTGNLSTDVTENVYKFTPTETTVYRIAVAGVAATCVVKTENGTIQSQYEVNVFVEALTAGQTYYFVVSARDEISESTSYNIAVHSIPELTVGTEVSVKGEAWYQFTPSVSGTYKFYDASDFCTSCSLYDMNFELLSDGDSTFTGGFRLTYELTAGETYILYTEDWGQSGLYFDVGVKQLIGEPTSIEILEGDCITAYQGDYGHLSVEILPEDCISGDITWESSNETIVSVLDEFGNIAFLAVGTATVTATLPNGVCDSILIEVLADDTKENPIVGLEVSDISIIEGISQHKSTEEIDGKEYVYLKYIYSTDYYYYPDVNYANARITTYTVTFQDGTSYTNSLGEGITMDGETYFVHTEDDQSYSNSWGVGEHTVSASLLGVTTTFTVEIVESPVRSLVVDKTLVYENIDGWSESQWDDEIEDYVDEYFHYYYVPAFTATLNDGQTLTSQKDDSGSYVTIDGYDYYLSYEDEQQKNPWDVGEHTITASLLGTTVSAVVEVVENPIEKIEFDDIEVIEGIHGHYFIATFYYDYTPSCTVYLKDGTTIESEDGYIRFNGKDYWLGYSDEQHTTAWDVGTHQATCKLLGFTGTFDVTVIANPYKSLTISGSNELVLTFTESDGTIRVETATGFEGRSIGGGNITGTLYTDKGQYYYAEFGCLQDENDRHKMDKNVSLTLGSMTSNQLDDCNWLKAQVLAEEYLYYSQAYYEYGGDLLGKLPTKYDGSLTEANINAMVTIAVNTCIDIQYIEAPYSDGYYVVDSETAQECVLQCFGISDINLTQFYGYDASAQDTVMVLDTWVTGLLQDTEKSFENNQWTIEGYTSPDMDLGYDSIKIIMDEEAVIQSIEFLGAENKKEVIDIEIENQPTKNTYNIGEFIDTSGLTLLLIYNDGTTETIDSEYTINGFDSTKSGTCTVTVEYVGLTTTFDVTIHDYQTEWSSDTCNHWHECSDCGDRIDLAPHTSESSCSVCGYKKSSDTKEDGHIGTEMPDFIDENTTETDYYIESVEQFNNFQAISKTNNFAGITVHLAANVSLDENFVGIGSTEIPFAGTFDGHGYAITKLSSANGLFVAIEGATIQKLVIGSAKVTVSDGSSYAGILVGTANGATIDNVTISKSKVITEAIDTTALGGMLGKVTGEVIISNSNVRRLVIKSAGETTTTDSFVGYAETAVTMSNCAVVNSYIGGTFVNYSVLDEQ